MRRNHQKQTLVATAIAPRPENRSLIIAAILIVALVFAPKLLAEPQETAATNDPPQEAKKEQPKAKVIGIKYNCVHVLKLEQTLKLYREILGFKMVDAEVLHGDGIEGMLIMKLKANDFTVCLSLTAPEYLDTIGPIGNTNHNHFMLVVNDIVTICDQLKEEGYELENEAYARDKYSFFTGPNGEIIGLTEYK